MAVRDWQFRRFFLAGAIPLLAPVVLGQRRGDFASPFTSGLSQSHLLPHLIGFVMMAVCRILVYSDHYRAAWIFLTVPIGSLRAFARGIGLALWIPGIALPHLIVIGSLVLVLEPWRSGDVCRLQRGPGVVLSCRQPSTNRGAAVRQCAAGDGAVFPAEPDQFLLVAGLIVALQVFVIFRHPLATLAATGSVRNPRLRDRASIPAGGAERGHASHRGDRSGTRSDVQGDRGGVALIRLSAIGYRLSAIGSRLSTRSRAELLRAESRKLRAES